MIIINEDETVTRTISEEEEATWVQEYREEVAYDKGVDKGVCKGVNDTAKRMLSDGVPIENIKKYTNLSTKEINSLKKDLNKSN